MHLPKEFKSIVSFAKQKCNDISYQQAAKGNWQKLLMILNKCKLNIDKKLFPFYFYFKEQKGVLKIRGKQVNLATKKLETII